MTVRPLFFFSRLARFILPTIILASAVRLAYTNLGQYDPSYDAGVYLESARMMRRGYPLYQVIFDSQPPLWLMLVSLSFHWFGESVLAGQLVTATAGLVTVMLIMGVGDVWNQVVTFHSAARAAFPSMAIGQKCRLMLGFADGERLLAYAAPFAVLSVLGGLEGLVPLLWAFCTFIGLLYHRPLFELHMVALIPSITMAAAVRWDQSLKMSRALL